MLCFTRVYSLTFCEQACVNTPSGKKNNLYPRSTFEGKTHLPLAIRNVPFYGYLCLSNMKA